MDPHSRRERRLFLAGLLRDARELIGLSIRQAAADMTDRQIAVTPQLLEAWEEGWAEPSASDLFAIALVYGCEPAELVGGSAWALVEPSEN